MAKGSRKQNSRGIKKRKLASESLEPRRMLASDWTNSVEIHDVNDDGIVAPLDALIIINELNDPTYSDVNSGLLDARDTSLVGNFFDVDCDGYASPIDVIRVINFLDNVQVEVEVGLAEDTGANGATDDDGVTANPTLNGSVTVVPGLTLTARVDSGDPIVIDFEADGTFTFTPSLAVDGSSNGDHTVELIASSPGSETVRELFTFTLQAGGAEAFVTAGENASSETSPFLEISFDAGDENDGLIPGDFSIVDNDGLPVGDPAIAVSSVTQVSDSVFQLGLSGPLADGSSYTLVVGSGVSDRAGNPIEPAANSFTTWERFRIFETSPEQGEEMVAPTREFIVRLTQEVDPASVNSESVRVLADSQPVDGRIVVSSTNRFFTFYPNDPWPESTQIRVEVDGNLILGPDGSKLDADIDATSGGIGVVEFRTLPLTRIPDTDVEGYVFDSYSEQPIRGATIRVDAFPELNVTTDSNGYFRLQDVPAPEFFVHIDGSTAANTPSGFSYPNVGKRFHSVPGTLTQINHGGEEFDIYLPPQADGDVQVIPTDPADSAEDVGFGPAGIDELTQMFPEIDPAEFEKLAITFEPRSAQDEFGNPATEANIIPVSPDRLPGPLPSGSSPQLVISVQAPGATTFDVPAAIRFPNLENRPVGAEVMFMSFDHDKGEWRPIGLGRVVDDGNGGTEIVSNEGVGILAPGWHTVEDPGPWVHDGDPTCMQQCENITVEDPEVKLMTIGDSDTISITLKAPRKIDGREHTPPEDAWLSYSFSPNSAFNLIYEITEQPDSLFGQVSDGETIKFKAKLRSEQELKDDLNSGKPFDQDILFGASLGVSWTKLQNGVRTEKHRSLLPFLYVDYSDDDPNSELKFRDAVGGLASSSRSLSVVGMPPEWIEVSSPDFSTSAFFPGFAPLTTLVSARNGILDFHPQGIGGKAADLAIKGELGDAAFNAGSLGLKGEGTHKTNFNLGKTSFLEAAIKSSPTTLSMAAAETLYGSVKSSVKSLVDASGIGNIIEVSDSASGGSRGILLDYNFVSDSTENCDTAFGCINNRVDFRESTFISNVVDGAANQSFTSPGDKHGRSQLNYYMDLATNISPFDTLDINFHVHWGTTFGQTLSGNAALVAEMADTIVHEGGHGLGLVHSNDTGPGKSAGTPDIMQVGGRGSWANSVTLGGLWVAADATSDSIIDAFRRGYVDAFNDRTPRIQNSAGALVPTPDFRNTPGLKNEDGVPAGMVSVLDGSGELFFGSTDFGNVGVGIADDRSFTLQNTGLQTVVVDSLGFASADFDHDLSLPLILAPDDAVAFSVTFTPSSLSSISDALSLQYDNGGQFQLAVEGAGAPNSPVLSYEVVGNNNFGGLELDGSGSRFVRFENEGGASLAIDLAIAEGSEDFIVLGGSSFALAPGAEAFREVVFAPSELGLRRGELLIDSNDLSQTNSVVTIVGTGIEDAVLTGNRSIQWGEDFLHVHAGGLEQNILTSFDGNFSIGLPGEVSFELTVFEPVSGLVARSAGVTGLPGASQDITSGLRFVASVEPDGDGDGLPDDIEIAIGTDLGSTDTDNDGLTDFAEIQLGLDPLDGILFPVGMISNLPISGEAIAISLEGSLEENGEQIAFVATGSGGIAVIDASSFDDPIILGELDLPGNAIDVAGDLVARRAVVATQNGGLHFVDISDPLLPALATTIAVPARQVEIVDGVAYVASANRLQVYDVATATKIDELTIFTNAELRGMAREGSFLYLMDADAVLRIVEITDLGLVERGFVPLPNGGGNLFVGNGVAYAAAINTYGRGGYVTADVSDPDNPFVISDSDIRSPLVGPGADIVTNGSGLGLLVGRSVFEIVNTSDSNETYELLDRIDLPADPKNASIASGIAYVALGTGGFGVVNYRPFDNLGVSPEAVVSTTADVDPVTSGVQVVEGRSLPITVEVSDDVQVRNAELLVNGVVVRNDVSFPFDFNAVDALAGTAGDIVEVQVRVTDTGANSALSNLLEFELVQDTFGPQVVLTTPNDEGQTFFTPSIDLLFDERIDSTLVALSGISLVGLGDDGVLGTADDFQPMLDRVDVGPLNRRIFVYPSEPLTGSEYLFTVDTSIVVDAVGNAMASDFEFGFTILPSSNIRAESGTPAIAQAPSANVGQTIQLRIPGVTPSTAVRFLTSADNGSLGTRDVMPLSVDSLEDIGYYTVPNDALTGELTLADGTPWDLLLQIVPTVNGIDARSITTVEAAVRVFGSGFVEGFATEYLIGTDTVFDFAGASGPNVFGTNSTTDFTLPLTAESVYGPITVTTEGGTSAAYSVAFDGFVGSALSGTPADANQASANPGQSVTLLGSNLTTATDLIATYINRNGVEQSLLLNPTAASVDGTEATFVVPEYFNGAFEVHLAGASESYLLQIVPVVDSFEIINTGQVRLRGKGFVEGNDTVYTFGGVDLVDSEVALGPNVYQGATDNQVADLTLLRTGSGDITMTTTGGASAPIAWNVTHPELGDLRDIAMDGDDVWVATLAGEIRQINLSTGETLANLPMPAGGSSGAGLDRLTAPMELAGITIPTGSLLFGTWNTNPDNIYAIDPSTGAVLSTLTLAENIDLVSMAYTPLDGGHLYVLDSDPDEVVEIDPADGSTIRRIASPVAVGGRNAGGLAVHPVTGNLWFAEHPSSTLAEVAPDGTLVQLHDLPSLGFRDQLDGIAFNNNGDLVLSSHRGFVSVVPVTSVDNDPLILTDIIADSLSGNPADTGEASANIGQAITLVGEGFNDGFVQAVFPTRDQHGNESVTVVPISVTSADGTQGQAVVPNLVTSGDVTLIRGSGRNYGFGATNDSIYRSVTLSFTANGDTAQIAFAGEGLQGVADESWGLDNVQVALASDPNSVVFSENFEGGASDKWGLPNTDGSLPATFTEFLGRFSNYTQTLSLDGLTDGEAYELTFDLYIIDTWDGFGPSGGPDTFAVHVDGETVFEEPFHFGAAFQTFAQNVGGAIPLQIVPTITGITGQPGVDVNFDLAGTGFMEGASTITIGGMSYDDAFANNQFDDVLNNNDLYRLRFPTAVEGPIRVTTAGGWFEIDGPSFNEPSFVELDSITATAETGLPAGSAAPSVNAHRTIDLTGRGFTNSTLVQFDAIDDQGNLGTITRTGTMSDSGNRLTVEVPALARSGFVRVVGSDAEIPIQIVPVVRSVGGELTEGSVLMLEGAGLDLGSVSVTVDGQAATVEERITTYDDYGIDDQQFLRVLVPAGVTDGEVVVTTSGGSFTYLANASISVIPEVSPGEVGDTLAGAFDVTLAVNNRASFTQVIGDNAFAAQDVDIYRIDGDAGDIFNLEAERLSSNSLYLRLFDTAGSQLSATSSGGVNGPRISAFRLPASGVYYLGVSGWSNTAYDPTVGGSGQNGTGGNYRLSLERLATGSSTLTSITSAAESGTPTHAAIAHTNAGQTITVNGSGLTNGDRVVFTRVNNDGYFYTTPIAPVSVSPDGTSLEVIVPADATTGMVRLERENTGLLLQIVPTVTDVEQFTPFHNGQLRLHGSGLTEAGTTIHFGDHQEIDRSRSNQEIDAWSGSFVQINVPSTTVPSGPISVSTIGGRSNVFGLELTGITASADTGTPRDSALPSANPGQAITIQGSQFDITTDVLFTTVNRTGVLGEVTVRPITVSDDGTSMTVEVPAAAKTGDVQIVGDMNATSIYLQVVPVVQSVDVLSVEANGTQVRYRLSGLGFNEASSQYQFGDVIVVDTNTNATPIDAWAQAVENDRADVYVPSGTVNYDGPITVTTEGGTSAAYSVAFDGFVGSALSGTPADANQASANPGQSVTLLGSNLTTATDLIATYINRNGVEQSLLLNPTAASVDGTEATFVVPEYFNGAFEVHLAGASESYLLQIVPVVDSFEIINTGQVRLRGKGFVEGNDTVYTFGGVDLVDSEVALGPNVYQGATDNQVADLTLLRTGSGDITMTTTGGASAPIAWNVTHPELGDLRDIAMDGDDVWVATLAGEIRQINLSTGETLANLPMPAGGSSGAGLDRLTAPMELAGITIPTGSLLFGTWNTNPDNIYAIDPSTGAVLSTLTLAENIDLVSMAYTPLDGGHLYVLDSDPDEVVEIDPADGSTIRRIASPVAVGGRNAGGLAVHPVTGNLWFAEHPSSTLAEVAPDGTLVQLHDLPSLGFRDQLDGIAFNNNGDLVLSSHRGFVSVVPVTSVDNDPLILTDIIADSLSGNPADTGEASANIGQAITLVGEGFNDGFVQAVFPTRDQHGNESVTVVPISVTSADGTQGQAVVPNLVTSGDVTLIRGSGRNYGFGATNDSIYRSVTLSFTANGDTAQIAFAGEGLQGVADESWGLDNVQVALASDPNSVVFSENFEGGASDKWGLPNTDGSLPATFTEFLGRFSNYTQTLSLDGLTDGEAYELTFDLYIIDTWDGFGPSGGPDTFAVHVDGETVFEEPFHFGAAFQTFAQNVGGAIPLQIVPTITGITGQPGVDVNFDLAGTGFMEGASTITIGGMSYDDAFANNQFDDVLNNNDLYRLRFPTAVEGPIRVTTAGGWFEIDGPSFNEPSFVELDSITATAETGLPAGSAAPSVNAHRTIDLTGRGFTNSTLVQFDAIDDQGNLGTITRTGTMSDSGNRLTVEVPALARSGFVRVVGSDAEIPIQIVPVVRSVGGELTEGSVLMLEGAGLDLGSVSVTVDGQAATVEERITTYDDYGIDDQQFLRVLVPAGVTDGEVVVTTSGGSFTYLANASISVIPEVSPGEVGDTLAGAFDVTLAVNNRASFTQVIGDNAFAAQDVDIYRIDGDAGDIFNLEAERLSSNSLYLRLFDTAGSQLSATSSGGVNGPRISAFRLPASGVYYLGVSGWSNTAYDPTVGGSGQNGTGGNYRLSLERLATGSSTLTSITSAAESGTPTHAAIAHTNAGQTITVNGSGLTNGDRVVFTRVNNDGYFYTTPIAPVSVSPDGTSLEVIVPADATTGMVRLERENTGLLLQIVPTVTDVEQFTPFHNGQLRLHGSGLTEAGTTIHFGDHQEIDRSRSNQEIDAWSGSFVQINVPSTTVPSGPISVSTIGGRSNVFGLELTGITASADTGTPRDSALPSANPGQAITIQGSQFDITTDVLFTTVNRTGVLGEVTVRPITVSDDGTSMTVEVPAAAKTGDVQIVGDMNATSIYLQVVPVVQSVDVLSVEANGTQVRYRLSGLGFNEASSQYQFGDVIVVDTNTNATPIDAWAQAVENDRADVYVPSGTVNYDGPITVTTEGGTSAAYSVAFDGFVGSALSGTPADANQASANPGQSVTLLGSNLTTATDLIATYINRNGVEQSLLLNPTAASVDGTEATFVVPEYFNGAFEVHLAGASESYLLQIVPVVDSFEIINTGQVRLRGKGFVEGNDTVYTFGGVDLVDSEVALGPNVYQGATDNQVADLTLLRTGSGDITMTTTGGASAPIAWNVTHPELGDLRDIAMDGDDVWVATLAGEIRQINLSTGETLANLPMPAGGSSGAGLDRLTAPMELAGITIPTGSLLFGTWNTNPDNIYAIDPSTGAVLSTLTLAENIDLVSMAYTPLDGGHLYVLDSDPDEVVEIDPADGSTIRRIASPVAVGGRNAGGLAVHPVTGNLWFAEHPSSTLAEVAPDGTLVQLHDLPSLGFRDQLDGIAFNNNGDLVLSSHRGFVSVVPVMSVAATEVYLSTSDDYYSEMILEAADDSEWVPHIEYLFESIGRGKDS